MQQETPALQQGLIPIGRLFSESWQVFRQLFWKLLLIYIFTFVPAVIIVLLNFLDKGTHPAVNAILFLLFVVSLLLVIVGQMAIIFAVKYKEKNLSAWQYFKMGLKKTHSGLWVYLLVFGIIALWVIVIGLFVFTPYFLMHVYAGTNSANGIVIFLEIFFGILLVITSVYVPIRLGIRYFFSTFLLVDQDLRGTNALAGSYNYSNGLTLKLFWRLLCLLLVYLILSLIFAFIFSDLLPVVTLTSIILGLLQGILSVYATVYSYKLYQSLRDSKGSADSIFSKAKRIRVIISAVLGLIFAIVVLSSLSTIAYFYLDAEVQNSGVKLPPATGK